MKTIKNITYVITLLLICMHTGCAQNNNKATTSKTNNMTTENLDTLQTAVFGAGCFWCVEAVFQRIDGVVKIESGYTNGDVKNPTYREVCYGKTGHAEVCKIWYDSSKVSFETLLSVFWQTHDPTTLNRQGNDVGTQYRSGVFYTTENQKLIAEKYKAELSQSGAFSSPIVTEITALNNYYPAEDYHQDYYNQNGDQPYCQFVIAPKLEKFKKVFGDKLRQK
ncbi:MAG: peptide-methionine (S)-S-oxide reductase MsrA [Bacteroidota bacterium]